MRSACIENQLNGTFPEANELAPTSMTSPWTGRVNVNTTDATTAVLRHCYCREKVDGNVRRYGTGTCVPCVSRLPPFWFSLCFGKHDVAHETLLDIKDLLLDITDG